MAGNTNLAPQQLSTSQLQQLFQVAQMPRHPPEVIARFPAMQKYDDDMQLFVRNLVFGIQKLGVVQVGS